MSKTILAVDDSGSLRQMVSFSLKAAGYGVVEAVDGQDALNKAKLQQVDLVAYVRFASVYRQFESVEEFKQELQQLAKEGIR